MTERRTVYFHMVSHPSGKEIRVGHAYSDRETAKSWTRFVKASWRGCPVRIEKFTYTLIDGVMAEADKVKLSERYNMDPPGETP